MAFRDREWCIAALDAAKARIAELQAKVAGHIASDEFDAARMLLTDLADAFADANHIANTFADKFGG